jgi:integrase
MAHISKHQHGKWRARWQEYPGGPEKSKNFDRKIDAQNFLATTMADIQRGTYVDPSAGKITFQTWAEQWREIQVWRDSTGRQVESHLRRHVYPVIGDRQIAQVKRSDIQALVKRLEQTLAPATVENVYRHVAAVFRAAVGDRLIPVSPCQQINLPKINAAKVTPLEVAQVDAIVETIDPRYRALVILAAGTGMRQGECFGLTVGRVDWFGNRITVDRQRNPEVAGANLFGPTKTEASNRTIPMPEVVKIALSEHLRQFGEGPERLIFTTATGAPMQRNRWAEIWNRQVRSIDGFPEWATFHDLRHFYASLLIRHGESIKVVQARLGHASATETLDTYSHLWPDSEDQTRRAIDSVLGSALTGQSRANAL